ncbi:MAG: alpha/beta hydrolase [Acidobacteriota bacterium]
MTEHVLRPPTGTLLKETRVVTDALSLVLAAPWALALPRGSGQTVMVLPGYMTSDRATVLLRGFLRALGHRAVGWGLGTNRGNVEGLLEPVSERVASLAEEAGSPIALVGWSLGGVLAREAARDLPALVSRVITLGTPVVGGPRYTIAAGAFAKHQAEIDAQIEERGQRPIEVPITSVYTETDGVVAWRACIDELSPDVEHLRVPGSHLGLGINPRVWSIVARRLADDPSD